MSEQNIKKSNSELSPVVTTERQLTPRQMLLAGLFAVVGAGLFGMVLYIVLTTSAERPVFSLETQHVPDGMVSLEVAQALATLTVTEPLPFFEKDAVAQSLHAQQIATSSSETYLSYYVFGQSKKTIQTAFIAYFKNLGWRQVPTPEEQFLVFSSDTHKTVSVSFFDVPVVGDGDEPSVVVALTARE